MFNILVVEDDKNLRKLMVGYLKKNNYNTFEAADGQVALEVLDHNHIDLIITDIMMPNLDGYELTKELREAKYNIPILMITAKDTLEDMKEGFALGSDDYMVKPINIDEMILRVGVLLKRANINNSNKIQIGKAILDRTELTVRRKNDIYRLTQKEFYLLFKLLSYPNKIFTRQDLMDEIWGMDVNSDPRTVDVHIRRLREKLENISEFKIETIRGLGYKVILGG